MSWKLVRQSKEVRLDKNISGTRRSMKEACGFDVVWRMSRFWHGWNVRVELRKGRNQTERPILLSWGLEFIPVSNEAPLKDWVKENKFKIGTPSSVGRRDKTTSHGQGRESTNTYGMSGRVTNYPQVPGSAFQGDSKHRRRKRHEDRNISLSCLQDSKWSYSTCVCIRQIWVGDPG